MNFFIKTLILYFAPVFVFAATLRPRNLPELVGVFVNIISLAIPVIISVAFLGFFWGIAQFILNSGNGKDVEGAKDTMLWGVIIIFVMFSVWGIIRILQSTFVY